METAFAFLVQLLREFSQQTALTQATAIATIFGSPLLLMTGLYRFVLSRERRVAEAASELAMQQTKLADDRAKQIRKLEADNKSLRQQTPAGWLESVERERITGNEERAIRILRNGFESVVPDLATSCLELAGHYLSFPDEELRAHLPKAAKYAHLAALCAPDERHAQELLEEIVEITAAFESADLPVDIAADDIEDFLEIEPGFDPTAAVTAFSDAAKQAINDGHYRRAERLARRGEIVGNRKLGPIHLATLRTRYYVALATLFFGDTHRARHLVDVLLSIHENVVGKEHPNTLSLHYLHAQVLERLGRFEDAMAAVDALLPIHEKVKGKENRDVLATRHLHAQVLERLGRFKDAMAAVNALLPIFEKVKGKEHPDTLSARHLHALLLDRLGRPDDAIAALDALLPLEEKVKGKEHPDTLTTRQVRAQVLDHLGRPEDAIAALDALRPLEEKVKGKEHPTTLRSRWLSGRILASMGNTATALDLLEGVLEAQVRKLPDGHPNINDTRDLIAKHMNKPPSREN